MLPSKINVDWETRLHIDRKGEKTMASRKRSRETRSEIREENAEMRRFYSELNTEERLLREKGNTIVQKKMWWAAGIGLLPLPLIDWAAVTAVQVALINDLNDLFDRSGQPPVHKQT